jgi:hypothetical protein
MAEQNIEKGAQCKCNRRAGWAEVWKKEEDEKGDRRLRTWQLVKKQKENG